KTFTLYECFFTIDCKKWPIILEFFSEAIVIFTDRGYIDQSDCFDRRLEKEEALSMPPKTEQLGRRTTIEDVAKAAGVSIATVSRVATASDRVSPTMRSRVLKAASDLNFELNEKGKAKIIAFILANRDVFNPFHAAIMVGAEAYCASHDCGLLFLPIRYGSN